MSTKNTNALIVFLFSACICLASLLCDLHAATSETNPPAVQPTKIKVAAIALATVDGMVEANYQRALRLVEIAGKDRPDIIILPEVFAAGYCADDLGPFAENLATSKPLQEFRRYSREYSCMIVLGYPEQKSDGLYNSAVIFDKGEILGQHYKSSLWPDDKRPWRDERVLVKPGPGMEVFPTRFGRLGVMICYENMIPGNWDLLKEKTDFVISLYNCHDDPSRHNIEGAKKLGVPSAWADRTGMYYRGKEGFASNPGTAGMVDAVGNVLGKSKPGVEEIITGAIEVQPRIERFLNPAPEQLTRCTDLTAEIHGAPIWIEHLERPCPADAPDWFRFNTTNSLAVNIAAFECSKPETLRLHLKEPVNTLTVRPKDLAIAVSGQGRDWTLALPGSCKLYIEIGSLPPLLVFADLPEAIPPSDPSTRMFGPGVHNPGLITLEDNSRIYLAPGAVVYGGFRGKPNNARIFGQGILDGSKLNSSMVRLDGARDVVIEGIMMRCGNAWQNTLQNCDNITYRNVKIMSFVPYGDGIDPVCSRNIRIENCFFRCSDDCIAVKAMKNGPTVSDITVQDCVMVGYNFSDGFTIGYEAVTETIERITVRNCDILYARGATKAGQHSAFSIICDGPATVRDVTFENIRVEENITRMFELNVTDGNFYSKAPPGRIQNVRLKNIQWEKACPIVITGYNAEHLVEDVVFEGCTVSGGPISATQIQTNEFTSKIEVR